MTDTPTTEEIPVPAAYVPPTRLQRVVAFVQRFIARNLAPNRALLYLTTLADVLVTLLALSKHLDIQQVTLVIGALVAVNTKVLAWIKGHQDMLSALYQRDLIAYQAHAQADLAAIRADQIAAVSKPGSAARKVTLPR